MRVFSFISTQWQRNLPVDLLRKWNNASRPSYGQSKGSRRVISRSIPKRADCPSYGSLPWGANLSPRRYLPAARQCPGRQFTVSATLKAIRRVKTTRVSNLFRSRRLTPYYAAREKKLFSPTSYRSLRVPLRFLPAGKLSRRVIDTKQLQPKAPSLQGAPSPALFETLRSLQLNEKTNSNIIWTFILRNAKTLFNSETKFSPGERSLLLEAFHVQLKEGFFKNAILTRSAIEILASRGILDENEWGVCIALMAKPLHQALHNLDEMPVEKRLATVFDTSIPLYVLMRAWKIFLNRKVVTSRTPHRSAVLETWLRKLSSDTNQQTQQHDSPLYESRFLAECGLEDYDINGITARRIVTASLMTMSAMTTWLGFNTGNSIGPSEAINGQAQFNVRTLSQDEILFMYLVISSAKGSSANVVMLRAGLANMGWSPSDSDLLVTSLRKLQVQSDAMEARVRTGWRGERRLTGAAKHYHARAMHALYYAIQQAADPDELDRIRDMTYTMHAKYTIHAIDTVMYAVFRQYLALNVPERALHLLAGSQYLQPSAWYMRRIVAHYLDKNDLEGFEHLCRIVHEENERISDLSFERYWELAGQDRALRLWLNNTTLHGSSLLLRRALQCYSHQKDHENFAKAWRIGVRNFQWIPRDLQQRRMEILMSFGQPAIAEAAIRDGLDPQRNAERLIGNMPGSIPMHFWNSTMLNLLQQGNEEQAESYLRLIGESEHANADTCRLFMRHHIAARNLRAAEKFAEKLYRKGELPDDTDASRHFLCSLENLHVLAKQPTPAEIYSTIQNALAFRYGNTLGQGVPQTPVCIQRENGTAAPKPGLSQAHANIREKHTWTSIEQTYLAMLATILDEGFEWGVTDGQVVHQSEMGDQNRKPKHELRARLLLAQGRKVPYTLSQRVEDALMLDNFRRRESGKVNTPTSERYDVLLRAALFALRRQEQLALLGGDHIAQGLTPGFKHLYLWDRFAHHFFVNHLHRFRVPDSALDAIYAMKLTSFGAITPGNLLNAGIKGSNIRKTIFRNAIYLQHEVWLEKLSAVSKMVNMSGEEIRMSRIDANYLQIFENMVILTQKVIKWSSRAIERAEAEFEDLKARRIVDITPYQQSHSLAYRWWRYMLQRAHLWASNSARDIEELEREWRDIRVNLPRLMLPAPERDLPGYLVYKRKRASKELAARKSRITRHSERGRGFVAIRDHTKHERRRPARQRPRTKSYLGGTSF